MQLLHLELSSKFIDNGSEFQITLDSVTHPLCSTTETTFINKSMTVAKLICHGFCDELQLTSELVMLLARYMSPNDPLPIFRTSRYLLPTMNSDLASRELDISRGSRLFMNPTKIDPWNSALLRLAVPFRKYIVMTDIQAKVHRIN